MITLKIIYFYYVLQIKKQQILRTNSTRKYGELEWEWEWEWGSNFMTWKHLLKNYRLSWEVKAYHYTFLGFFWWSELPYAKFNQVTSEFRELDPILPMVNSEVIF
jgi:hypothetical protein